MKYSYNWLKELSGTKMPAEKAAALLTMHSFELEGVEKIGQSFENIIAGKILEIKKHPNADKLRLTVVDIGNEKLDIVCGAPNIEVGQKVPVALVGAKLPSGMEIKEAEIRGVKSRGMMCSQDELGIGKDRSGIYILDPNTRPGTAFAKYFNAADDVLEIKVLPDRSHDALSHAGVAREISALEGKEMPYDFFGITLPRKRSKAIKVEIKDPKLCPRYIAAVLKDVEIKDSPVWMKTRLKAAGVNSINNVVDATNYVMLELGQPLHAFDFEEITEGEKVGKIVVRRAKDKERLTLLDNTELTLDDTNLLITNGENPLGLAGIMGGKKSGIKNDVRTIVIESANFFAANIRQTRIQHKLKTEASDRYEKGLDPNLAEKAAARVIEILGHIAGAKLEGIVDVYPKKVRPLKINLSLDYVDKLLGASVPLKEAERILNYLAIGTRTDKKKKRLECLVPTFRLDIATQEDLIEEIGRIWGYSKITSRPMVEEIKAPAVAPILILEKELSGIAKALGFDEMYNYSFYSKKEAEFCGLDLGNHFELSNPMNPEQELIRASLIPNILKNVHTNFRNFETINIFEIGRAYLKNERTEKRWLVMATVIEKDRSADSFYVLKGAVEDLLERLDIQEAIFEADEEMPTCFHPARTARISVAGENIGTVGEINLPVLARYKIGKRVAVAEIDVAKLLAICPKEKIYKPLGKFPTIKRDISLITGKENRVKDIVDAIRLSGGELVKKVEIFDIFQKDNSTSLAFHITFAADRTLENKEADEAMERIVKYLEEKLAVKIRKN